MMEQENGTVRVERKYNNKKNQVAKVNKTTIISLTFIELVLILGLFIHCLLYTSPSPRD